MIRALVGGYVTLVRLFPVLKRPFEPVNWWLYDRNEGQL